MPRSAHPLIPRTSAIRSTDRPEGDEVELVPRDNALASGGEERDRLHRSIDRGLDDVKAGRTIDARHVIEELRARAGGL